MDSKINVAVEGLTFSLYQRPLHPELFDIFARRDIFMEHYDAQIWVTGCTHIVSVFSKDLCLTEIVHGPDQLLPHRGLVERFNFRGSRSHKCTLSRGLSYMTDFQVEKMSANLFVQSHKDLTRFARNRGVFVKYPGGGGEEPEPFCYVDFEARRDELHIHTFAAYPDQLTMIKTQSLFDFH